MYLVPARTLPCGWFDREYSQKRYSISCVCVCDRETLNLLTSKSAEVCLRITCFNCVSAILASLGAKMQIPFLQIQIHFTKGISRIYVVRGEIPLHCLLQWQCFLMKSARESRLRLKSMGSSVSARYHCICSPTHSYIHSVYSTPCLLYVCPSFAVSRKGGSRKEAI